MWLFNSSVGRKFVMAVTGACLVLFVTFHVLMNAVALIWPHAYNQVCEFLGANWYALVASAGLAALFIIHIIYACWLTLQNKKARGNDAYKVTSRPAQVEWASKNMLVLGIVILAFLVVHMIQFWAKMQWQELRHAELAVLPQLEGVPVPPAQGTLFLQLAFSQVWTPIVYIIGFVALWFHMNHGFWSMFQSTGWNGESWLPRLKKIGCWWTSIVVALFIAQAIVFTVQANKDYYLTNPQLQEQYAEYWTEAAGKTVENFEADFNKAIKPVAEQMQNCTDMAQRQLLQQQGMQIQAQYIQENGKQFVEDMNLIKQAYAKYCPDVPESQEFQQQVGFSAQIQAMMEQINTQTANQFNQ